MNKNRELWEKAAERARKLSRKVQVLQEKRDDLIYAVLLAEHHVFMSAFGFPSGASSDSIQIVEQSRF